MEATGRRQLPAYVIPLPAGCYPIPEVSGRGDPPQVGDRRQDPEISGSHASPQPRYRHFPRSSRSSLPSDEKCPGIGREAIVANIRIGFEFSHISLSHHAESPARGHSDRGVQYVSIRYTERLAEAGIEPSVGSVGD